MNDCRNEFSFPPSPLHLRCHQQSPWAEVTEFCAAPTSLRGLGLGPGETLRAGLGLIPLFVEAASGHSCQGRNYAVK